MSARFRKFLLSVSPLLSVMAFLALLNLAIALLTGATYPWAIFPILGMAIPVFIRFSRTMLGEEPEENRARRRDRDRDSAERAVPVQQSFARPAVGDALSAQVAQARTYQQAVADLARGSAGQSQAGRLGELSSQFETWVKSVTQMADRIRAYKQNAVIQQDLASVPASIQRLEGQLAAEKDERLRAQFVAALESRRNQLGALEKLGGTMRQAELQLENTVAALGTIYSQALAGQSTNHVAGYADLAGDMNDRVKVLQDQIEALEEVKIGRAATNLGG